MDKIKQWYADRVSRGELSIDGWSRDFSQELRWRANLQLMRMLTESNPSYATYASKSGKLNVVDFGCGTGSFFFWHNLIFDKYVGIEMREDAFEALERNAASQPKRMQAFREIPKERVPGNWNVLICNAAYGFAEQDPVADMCALDKAFDPDVYLIDFFSTQRPYEPDMDGYRAFHPWSVCNELMRMLKIRRFVIDHAKMPHVFTVGLSKLPTPWEVEEIKRGKTV